MLKLLECDDRISIVSSRICSVQTSDKTLKGDSQVLEVQLKVDFKEFEQFHAQFDGRNEFCSCHIGSFSTHLKDDLLQLIAVWYPPHFQGMDPDVSLCTRSEHAGDMELVKWEVADMSQTLEPADADLHKRARSIQLHQLVQRGASLGTNKDWIDEALHTANRLRVRHTAGALQWSQKAATEARKVADKLAAASKKGPNMVYTTAMSTHQECFKRGLGQSIHLPERLRFGDLNSGKVAIIDWYEQQFNPGYDFAKAGKMNGTNEFTQLVWKSSTHMGMDCDSLGMGFIVACFSPPGNLNGQFGENVSPQQGNVTEKSICKARFQAFDKNGDNHLSSQELTNMLRTLDPSFSPKEIQFVMQQVDKNSNGKIDFDEFLNWTFPRGFRNQGA
jgi:hypothetical protein